MFRTCNISFKFGLFWILPLIWIQKHVICFIFLDDWQYGIFQTWHLGSMIYTLNARNIAWKCKVMSTCWTVSKDTYINCANTSRRSSTALLGCANTLHYEYCTYYTINCCWLDVPVVPVGNTFSLYTSACENMDFKGLDRRLGTLFAGPVGSRVTIQWLCQWALLGLRAHWDVMVTGLLLPAKGWIPKFKHYMKQDV